MQIDYHHAVFTESRDRFYEVPTHDLKERQLTWPGSVALLHSLSNFLITSYVKSPAGICPSVTLP